MDPARKLFEQKASNTRPEFEEHMLIAMDKSTHEENLSQPVQFNDKQFKIFVTLLTGSNGAFIVTKSYQTHFVTVVEGVDFIQLPYFQVLTNWKV